MVLTALFNIDLKEIGLPFTGSSWVLLFVVKLRREKSSFVFGLNKSFLLFWCWFIWVLVFLFLEGHYLDPAYLLGVHLCQALSPYLVVLLLQHLVKRLS